MFLRECSLGEPLALISSLSFFCNNFLSSTQFEFHWLMKSGINSKPRTSQFQWLTDAMSFEEVLLNAWRSP